MQRTPVTVWKFTERSSVGLKVTETDHSLYSLLHRAEVIYIRLPVQPESVEANALCSNYGAGAAQRGSVPHTRIKINSCRTRQHLFPFQQILATCYKSAREECLGDANASARKSN